MAYSPKIWTTGETITAAELNALEQAASAASAAADTANTGLTSKVNSSTYTAGLAAKANIADVGTAGTPTGDAVAAAIAAQAAGGLTVAATVTTAGALVASKHNPVDASSGALTVTLPTGTSGKLLAVEKTDTSTNAVTVSGSLRGSASTIALVWARETLLLASDSSGSWWPIAGHKTKASLDAAYAPAATTKRITMPISSDGSTSTATGFTDIVQRSIILIPATTTRWRLRVRNITPKTQAVYTGALALTNTYVGAPALAADGSWSGAFTAAPVQALTGASTPVDGSEWVSAWVTDPTAQFKADTPSVISWGFTCPSSQNLSRGNTRIARTYVDPGVASQVGQQAQPSGTMVNFAQLLDVRVEFETVTAMPVILVVGDSTASGNVDDDNMTPTWLGPHYTWPGQMSLAHRCLVINAGIGGALTSDFTTINRWAFNRFDLTTTPPDAVIVGTGINDADFGAVASATYQNNVRTVLNGLTSTYGIQRHIVTTVLPQPRWKSGHLTQGIAIGATSITTDTAFASGDSIMLDIGLSTEETVTASAASSGLGPYTTTLSAATTKAHGLNATTGIGPQEGRRRAYNTATRRNNFSGGVLDFANALPEDRALAPWFGSGTVHPGAGTYALLGRTAKVI